MYCMYVCTKLGAQMLEQILAQSAETLITYSFADIAFKSTYRVPGEFCLNTSGKTVHYWNAR